MADNFVPVLEETILKWPFMLGTARNHLASETSDQPLVPYKSLKLVFIPIDAEAKGEPMKPVKSLYKIPADLRGATREHFIQASQVLCKSARKELDAEKKETMGLYAKVRGHEERAKREKSLLSHEYCLLKKKIVLWKEKTEAIEEEYGEVRSKKAGILSKYSALGEVEKYLKEALEDNSVVVWKDLEEHCDKLNDDAKQSIVDGAATIEDSEPNQALGRNIIMDDSDEGMPSVRTSSPICERGANRAFSKLIEEARAEVIAGACAGEVPSVSPSEIKGEDGIIVTDSVKTEDRDGSYCSLHADEGRKIKDEDGLKVMDSVETEDLNGSSYCSFLADEEMKEVEVSSKDSDWFSSSPENSIVSEECVI